MTNFRSYAEYYDQIYDAKNYRSEVDFIIDRLRSANPNVRKLIDFGCGTGRHLQQFSLANFDVVGVDRSAEMTTLAKKRNPSVEFWTDDIRNFRSAQKYDAVTSLFHVVSYLITYDDLQATMISAASHLDKHGLFLFDVWHGPGVLHLKPESRVTRHQLDKCSMIRTAEPVLRDDINQVDVNITIQITEQEKVSEFKEAHQMRYYFIPEIEYFLELTGFRLLQVNTPLENRRPDIQSWGAMYLAQKK